MKNFFNTITLNNIKVLAPSFWHEVLHSILQGQPYFVILMVTLTLLDPLLNPGIQLNLAKLGLYIGWLALSILLLFLEGRKVVVLQTKTAYHLGAEGRIKLGDYLRKLSMGFYKGKDPGDITALMMQDYSNIEMMLSQLLMSAIGAVVMPVIFLIFLVPLDWRMALITLSPIPLALIAATLTRMIVMHTGQKHIKCKNQASSRMLEYLEGIKSIKSYNLTGRKFSRLENAFKELKKESIRVEATGGPLVILGIWFLNVGIAMIMIMGLYFILQGSLAIAHFLFFLIIGTRMYDPLTKVLVSFVELSYFSISAKRINEIYQTKPLPEPVHSESINHHDIDFKNVSFRYHNTDVLKQVNFTMKHNQMTALVGPSGSGKSTITRLIARFWDVNQGEITIGGIPITKTHHEDLMNNISMVFQDVYLFNDTILNNIKIGNNQATMEEVISAAKKAQCHNFIQALDSGYDTMVGEGGATLSGGEKQRISIARAILKNAPIILLDEATASLDPENELYIQKAIDELIKGRTLVVIAHRLSTITHADQILVLKDGKIIERGTHQELLSNTGLYQSMWNEQERAFHWKLTGKNAS
ncbi:MAG: ABC transporter ATP-binding protein/permease [Spirochaetes bacterium]|nr:ABC transporter ATP-binding protein/permease [Spirochaetota bacterium]